MGCTKAQSTNNVETTYRIDIGHVLVTHKEKYYCYVQQGLTHISMGYSILKKIREVCCIH